MNDPKTLKSCMQPPAYLPVHEQLVQQLLEGADVGGSHSSCIQNSPQLVWGLRRGLQAAGCLQAALQQHQPAIGDGGAGVCAAGRVSVPPEASFRPLKATPPLLQPSGPFQSEFATCKLLHARSKCV